MRLVIRYVTTHDSALSLKGPLRAFHQKLTDVFLPTFLLPVILRTWCDNSARSRSIISCWLTRTTARWNHGLQKEVLRRCALILRAGTIGTFRFWSPSPPEIKIITSLNSYLISRPFLVASIHAHAFPRLLFLKYCIRDRIEKMLKLVPSTLKWKLMDRQPIATWIHPAGRLVLLGDSCHPMLVRPQPLSLPNTLHH